MYKITISVGDLVEFALRKGDIDFKYTGRQRGKQGTKAHQKIQNSYKKNKNYKAEVTICDTIDYNDFQITLQGRIDGVLEEEHGIIIDEIKSTRVSLDEIEEEFNEMHWAQGKVYAFLYCNQNHVENIEVQLTYYNLDTKEIKKIKKTFSYYGLKEYVENELLQNFIKWAFVINKWKEERDNSIKKQDFPHKNYRSGQRKLVISIYKTIKDNKKIFFNAPTGIGKTISTIYPAIISFSEGYVEKIFYLTSKNTQKDIVEATIENLCNNNLKIKYLSLTAKEKICIKDQPNCNPDYCELAKGHFDRINDAVEDIFCSEYAFTKDVITQYAEKHRVCPFEYSLDLSLWSDIVICDYNYIFDPRVSLKRFTEEKGKYVFLIDEAHNLVDRSRDMYSCEIGKKKVLNIRKNIGKDHPMFKILGKINSEFLKIKKQGDIDIKEKPEEFIYALQDYIYKADKWLSEHNSDVNYYDDILQFYFEVNNFIRIAEYFGDNYRVIITKYSDEVIIKLVCLDSSKYIRGSVEQGVASVFFSATLLPLPYFIELFGGKINDDYHMVLDSPFTEENMCLMICNHINTTYKSRESSYEQICELIYELYGGKKGNYMVFFPSYEYMETVYNMFSVIYPDIKIIEQLRSMDEVQRSEFLNVFDQEKNIIAFAVLGGIFSESIDLFGDKLIGTIIVSVGLPKIGVERDILKDYYNDINGRGFQYAYMYPGFNKVMQGVGRVIRSEEDRGVVLLIDNRYAQSNYKKLFPGHWKNAKYLDSKDKLNNELKLFWKE
ncbi:ATP-dependent DNA helicase [Alkalibaculum sp. M08DMB]|uniref:ATP-dependent DNA helicase n=1 Tax=Alkalibaculum sporogenes TaxID=2655001 RepID=A0A6A7KAL2_9FIRM|nr:ATP-dependent DNA helicase [Alkalibaculum sporogenes]MPW26589.1 ATP-dependent DNA helicase [Alkalibaculum sporogenes]